MIIVVNGKRHDVPETTSVDDVVARFRPAPARAGVAVAVNGAVVARSDWQRRLTDGDRVEVVAAVQGGAR